MIAFVLSENDKHSEIEKLGYSTCDEISIFDKPLSYYQNLCLEGIGENLNKINVKVNDIPIVKKYIESTNEKYSVFYYENCFFDFSVNDIIKNQKMINNNRTFYCDTKNNLVFALVLNEQFRDCFLKNYSEESLEKLLEANCLIFTPDFYYRFLDTYSSFKELHFDILNDKTNVFLPNIAKGIYTDGKLPDGDYTIVPPVYISGDSQIEEGCVVGPISVVSKNTLISNNSRIINSVLCENTYISADCLVENSVCGKNTSVKKGAAILNNCVLGYDSLLGDGILIENGAIILPEIRAYSLNKDINSHLDFDFEKACLNNLDVFSACKLGVCFGKIFNSPSVCIGCDDDCKSITVKLAFVSGLCSSGCECFDIGTAFSSKLFYTSLFCQLDYSLYFYCTENGVSLEIFNENCENLNKVDLYNLIFLYRYYKLENFTSENAKKIKQIKGISKVYLRDLKSLLPEKIRNKYYVKCNNQSIQKIINLILKTKLNYNIILSSVEFLVNDSGTELNLVYNNKKICHNDLIDIVELLEIRRDNNNLISKLYKKDALVLLFEIISYIEDSNENCHTFFNFLDYYKIFEREYIYESTTGKFLNNLLTFGKTEYKNGKLYIINRADKFFLKINSFDKKIKVISKTFDVAHSEEIINDLDKLFDDINKM